MKKIIVLIAALTFSLGANAQETKEKKMDKMDHMDASMKKDHVMLHDGKVMVVKGGKSTVLTEDMTLDNGTMVMKDGTMMMKDGTSKPLKEGEVVYMDGKMGKMNMKEHKSKKGSTK